MLRAVGGGWKILKPNTPGDIYLRPNSTRFVQLVCNLQKPIENSVFQSFENFYFENFGANMVAN